MYGDVKDLDGNDKKVAIFPFCELEESSCKVEKKIQASVFDTVCSCCLGRRICGGVPDPLGHPGATGAGFLTAANSSTPILRPVGREADLFSLHLPCLPSYCYF